MTFLRKMRKIPLRGYQFLSYDALQHARAILTLSNDLKLRKRLGENAKKKAKQYDANMAFPKILQVYQEISRKT